MSVIENGLVGHLDGHWEIRKVRRFPPQLEAHVTYRRRDDSVVTTQFTARTRRGIANQLAAACTAAFLDPEAKPLIIMKGGRT